MTQRVVIAMALACNPKLLLADEPTTALDVTIQAQVLDMMSRLKDKLNTSVILITHDLGVVANICQSVAVVYAGEIVAVSYTHLDVYKRQLPRSAKVLNSLINFFISNSLLNSITATY